MGSVLCVTRGGKGGIRAQKEAIRIAKDRGAPLFFVCVVDSSFLNKLAAPKVIDVNGILESMGRFLLQCAVERASAETVSVDSLVCHGTLRKVLPCIVSETDATTIVIGHLAGHTSCFKRAELDQVPVSMKE